MRPYVTDLAQEGEELALHEGVEALGGLVEDQQLGVAHEGLHDADLATVAVGQHAHPPVQVEVEPLGQRGHARPVGASAQGAEQADQLASRHVGVAREVARQVADAALDPVAVRGHVDAEDLGPAGRRAPQPGEQLDRGRLARAVGPEVAEHAPRGDEEVEVAQDDLVAEALGEARRADGVLHAGLLGIGVHMASGLKSATLSAPVSPARENTS